MHWAKGKGWGGISWQQAVCSQQKTDDSRVEYRVGGLKRLTRLELPVRHKAGSSGRKGPEEWDWASGNGCIGTRWF